jgi:capsular exopolysaccharide synthesis family protein
MTRLSEALRRAAEQSTPTTETPATGDVAAPAWQFSPVETMHVPVEPERVAPPELERSHVAPAKSPSLRGATPRIGALDREKLVVSATATPGMVEQYRRLAAVLHHAQQASGVKSVMITSALPSEGKTLTASNLALTLSESYQRRVLVIDADLRRPRMHEVFGLPQVNGLSESLTRPNGGDRLPLHAVSKNLWVLTAGRTDADPMGSLVSPAMKQLLGEARESFDFVVVDTPPIAILTDANLLATMIDTAILVVSARSTPYPMVQRAADTLGASRILGVVLNRAEETAVPDNYDYYGYSKTTSTGTPATQPASKRRWFSRWRKRPETPHVQ